jgi:hypothetical protein
MPVATSNSLPGPATFVKMEDRKRPAVSAVDDLAPPSKRQAVNGGSKSKDDSGDSREEAWIEVSLQAVPKSPPPFDQDVCDLFITVAGPIQWGREQVKCPLNVAFKAEHPPYGC